MSQPRRRRRRGRRGRGSSGGENQGQQQPVKREQATDVTKQSGPDGSRPQGGGGRRKRRRRRGKSGGGGGGGRRDNIPSPKLSEDLFGLLTKGAPPEKLTADADGQDLDELIGELQSTWGVPQYPQEYRITIKIAETKERKDGSGDNGRSAKKTESGDNGPKREKAPSPAKLAAGSGDGPAREQAPRRRKRRRGRSRRRGGGGGSSGPS